MLARLLDVLFIDMRRPVGAHVGTDMTAFGADHLRAECPDEGRWSAFMVALWLQLIEP